MSLLGVYVPTSVFYIYIFAIGMCLGSFFMVVGVRVPRQETLHGRSHCDNCQHQLAWWHVIPVMSYFILKGKCHYCASKIGRLSPIFEVLSGCLFLLAAVLLKFSPETLVSWTMLSLVLIISVSDSYYRIIPNKVLLPFFFLAIILRLLIPQNEFWWYPLAGFLVGFLPLYLLTGLKEKAMGGGDIKLFAVLGVFVGPIQVLISLFVSSFIALIFYLLLFIFKKEKQQFVPFGPFIAIGSVVVYLVSAVLGN